MPIIVDNNPNRGYASLSSTTYDYQYPPGLDFSPRSPLHEKVKKRILDRAQESWATISQRHPAWDRVDDTLKAFIPADEKERAVRNKDSRKPVSIVVPITYAIRETLNAHLLAIFSQDGIWQYEARTSEDVGGCALLENLVDAQSKRFKHLLSLNTFINDGLSKGIGAMAPVWETKYGLKEQIIQDPLTGQSFNVNQPYVQFEGNRLRNINPRLYLPDPNVPADAVQDGDFVGWVWRDSANGLLEEEFNNPDYFNARYLKHISDGRSGLFKDRYGENPSNGVNSKPVDVIYMYDKLVPAEVGLGPSEYPEIWAFTLAGDQVITSAKPLGLKHNMFPVAVCAPDSDGYETCPIARLEVTMGLQTYGNFMINSRIADVRKNIAGITVYDPSVINTNDLINDKPFKYVRIRRSMFGQNAIEKGFRHFPSTVSTGGHLAEVASIDSMASRYNGAVESMQGSFQKGERRSAEEARISHMSGVGRVEKMARVMSEQALGDLGYMIASHTQQLMQLDTQVNITGRLHDDLIRIYDLDPETTRVPIGPADIANLDVDVIIRDGSLPSSAFIQENVQLMQLALADPRISQQYDTARWMAELAKNMGIKNINDFRIKANVLPVSQIEQGMASGDLQAL